MAGLPGLPPPGFADAMQPQQAQPQQQSRGLPGLPPPGFAGEEPTLGSESQGVFNRFASGVADLGSFIEGINPVRPGGPRYAAQIADLITGANTAGESGAQQSLQLAKDFGAVTEATPQTGLGKIAGEVAYYGPSAALPGGSLGSRLASSGGAGLAAGTLNAMDFGQGAQAVGGLVGSMTPLGAAGIAKAAGIAGDDFERMALNIQRSDLKRADRFAKVPPGEDPKLIQALDGARSRGLMSGDRSPAALVERNQGMIEDLGGKVNTALKQADAGQLAAQRDPIDEIARVLSSTSGSGGDDYLQVGLRGLYKSENPGQLKNSRVWVDGNPTDELLDGTSTIGIGEIDASVGIDGIKQQLLDLDYAKALAAARKYGDSVAGGSPNIGIVIGDRSGSVAEDAGEKILKNAELLGVLKEGAHKKVMPQMKNAAQFIKGNPYEAEKLGAQLENRMNAINQSWDGTVSGLNEMKQQLYRISYNGTAESKALDRAIARDLKEAVEAQAAQFGGDDLAAQIRTLNAQQGENLTLRDILQKGAYNDEMPGGAAKALRRVTVSPIGGIGVGGLTSVLSGNPFIGAAAGIGALATTRKGQFALSDLSRATARYASKAAGGTMPGALPAATSSGLRLDETQGRDQLELDSREIPQAISKIAAQIAAPRSSISPTKENSLTSSYSYNPGSGLPPAKGYEEIAAALMGNNTSVPGNSGKLKQMLDAIKTIESGGDTKAVSPKGAKGAYQFMDATGKEYHRRLGLTEKYDPTNIKQQEKLAAAFLGDLVKKYGDEKTAAAAYNAGEPAVDKAIKRAGSNRWEDYYFYLPNETRAYGAKYENARA